MTQPEIRGASHLTFCYGLWLIVALCEAFLSRKAWQYAPEVHRMRFTMLCEFRVDNRFATRNVSS